MDFFELKDDSDFISSIPFSISFHKIDKYKDIDIRENASLFIFYIIKGNGTINNLQWKEGDLFIYPYLPNGIQFYASNDTELFLIQNSPLLTSMGVKPYLSLFEPKKYLRNETIESENIKKFFLKPDKMETIHIQKNTFILCISDCFKKVKSYIQQKEILWKNGKVVFIRKGNFLTFYTKNKYETIFLIIE